MYPFEWLALFPLLSLHCEGAQGGDCVEDARALLRSTQQRLPDSLTRELESLLATGDDTSRLSLARRALAEAEQYGYL